MQSLFHSASSFHYDLGRAHLEHDAVPTTKRAPDAALPSASPAEPPIPVIELDQLLREAAPEPADTAAAAATDGDGAEERAEPGGAGPEDGEALDAQQSAGRRAFGAVAGLDAFADAARAARQADIARRVTGGDRPSMEYEARKLVCEAAVWMRSSSKLLSGLTHRRLLLFEGPMVPQIRAAGVARRVARCVAVERRLAAAPFVGPVPTGVFRGCCVTVRCRRRANGHASVLARRRAQLSLRLGPRLPNVARGSLSR
jgi:hypothetical protein